MNTSSFVRSNLNRIMVVFATFTLILWMSSSLRAQTGRSLPENVPQQGDPDRQVRAQEIEAERARRDPQLIMAEVNEDFGRLRAISEEMKLVIKAAPAPDYRHVADSSAEIKKRATRLKANIVFPPPPKDEKRQKNPDPDEFQPLLATMDKLLTSFLRNPIFTDTGGIDVQLANKARYDLEDMIKLSDKLRKSADKMQKNAGKS
ncbi:MAG: hypothetical protein H0W99_02505 [Acidobacteria bacterium]|nr:hypothetical protein [Acidobacteriota bacterium]